MSFQRFALAALALAPAAAAAPGAEARNTTRLLFGSCSDTRQAQPLWSVLKGRGADAFFWAGDVVYGDEPSPEAALMSPTWRSILEAAGSGKSLVKAADGDALRKLYAEQTAHSDYANFIASVPNVDGTWDDHDYGVDNGDSGSFSEDEKDDHKAAFLDFLDYSEDRARLFDLMINIGVKSPFFVSGDVHYAELSAFACTDSRQRKLLGELTTSGMTHSWGSSKPAYYDSGFLHKVKHWIIAVHHAILASRTVNVWAHQVAQGHFLDLNVGEIEIYWDSRVLTSRVLDQDGNIVLQHDWPLEDLDVSHLSGDVSCAAHRGPPSPLRRFSGFCLTYLFVLAPFFLIVLAVYTMNDAAEDDDDDDDESGDDKRNDDLRKEDGRKADDVSARSPTADRRAPERPSTPPPYVYVPPSPARDGSPKIRTLSDLN
ncbi:hypothetical protein M885DRAFT_481907 [Pelagophyceae sp. CCMP2097]|nr:hypothetical protein M885DRAFT_481907 [Pelagophyceae sp. CCMP2097]